MAMTRVFLAGALLWPVAEVGHASAGPITDGPMIVAQAPPSTPEDARRREEGQPKGKQAPQPKGKQAPEPKQAPQPKQGPQPPTPPQVQQPRGPQVQQPAQRQQEQQGQPPLRRGQPAQAPQQEPQPKQGGQPAQKGLPGPQQKQQPAEQLRREQPAQKGLPPAPQGQPPAPQQGQAPGPQPKQQPAEQLQRGQPAQKGLPPGPQGQPPAPQQGQAPGPQPKQQPAQKGLPPAPQGQPPAPQQGQAPGPQPKQQPAEQLQRGQPPQQGAQPAPQGQPPSTPQQQGQQQFRRVQPAQTPTQPQPQGQPGGQPQQTPVFSGRPGEFDALRAQRQERREGDRTVIIEPDRRMIVRDTGGRVFIRHDDNARLRLFAPDARFERRGDATFAFYRRPGGYEIINETDADGRLLRRIRREPDGREIILIDNGRPITEVYLDLPAPVIRIPRERYIVDISMAPEPVIYETLEAPPVMPIERAYSLDEVRYNVALRDRMRRIDVNTLTFEFGSWEVTPDQIGRLQAIAQAMSAAISRNANEVFMIEGHTDAVGSDVDNLSLSDRRAEAVANILTETYQIPPENLVTQGYGEQYLKVQTDGPSRENRRVTVRRITPLLTGENR